MKKLNIQIDKKDFRAIRNGEQKVVRRYVYPNNKDKYVAEEDKNDENGEEITIVTPIHYDALQLSNGRKKDAPRMTVEVVSSEFVVLTDEEGKDLTYTENGLEYYVCQVWYTLGDILETENFTD